MQELIMNFDPHTIEHLGIQMYSRLPNALAELIANAYDADASVVDINLYDKDGVKSIEVSDNGIGMSFDEVNDLFLRIGRHRREHDSSRTTAKGRTITGRKGLGKLALFGIGKNINITTQKEGSKESISFDLNWLGITNCTTSEYKPHFQISEKQEQEHGTKFILSDLSRKSPFDLKATAVVISKLFNLIDDDFEIYLSLNDSEKIKITPQLKYGSLESEFEWDVETLCNDLLSHYKYKNELKGKIISTPKPVSASLRGITLYVNGRLANESGFFGISDSSHGYSYFTGWIEANFIDELPDDLISTDRQSLNWELEITSELQQSLQLLIRSVERKWREQRKNKKETQTEKSTNININAWTDTMSPELGNQIKKTVESITEDESISTETAANVVKNLHKIIPEYPQYHFRELHPQIQEVAKTYYEQKEYYVAFWQSLLRYKNLVKIKSKCSADKDRDIMAQSFGKDKILSVTKNKQIKPNGDKFSDETIENIEEGQKFLSMGIVAGARNILSHEEINDLKDSELFTEKDCLDLLSLLSHLFKRLDDAE